MIPKPKLKRGDIVVNKSGWRRFIRSSEIVGDKVVYSYYNELLDNQFHSMGTFNQFDIGCCSEKHLLTWGIKE